MKRFLARLFAFTILLVVFAVLYFLDIPDMPEIPIDREL